MTAAGARSRELQFDRTRLAIFGILLAGFVLSFFHRTAPAAIAGELTSAFSINSAVLGTLAATYFFVYTLLQIPVGVMADTLGPRLIVTIGALIAGAGSLLFGLAPSWEVAAIGRTFVGIGVSVAFISLLKISAVWFPANRFATLVGVVQFAGNLGAVIAGAPLAWVVTVASWRTVFVGLGLLSIAMGIAAWNIVRDRPEQRGFPPVQAALPAGTVRTPWRQALFDVLANAKTWPTFFVNIGIGGSFLAFAGLWAVPYLQQVYGMPRNVAAQHGSVLLLGVAIGSLVVGALSDRLRNRRDVMRALRISLRDVVAAVAAALAAVAACKLCVVFPDGLAYIGLRAHVDRGQGSESARTLRHGDIRRQRRHFLRRRCAAAAGWLGARPRTRGGRRGARLGQRADVACGHGGVRRPRDAVRPRDGEDAR